MDSFGQSFRMTIFGESHSPKVGVSIEGVPSGIPLCEDDFTTDIDRRRSGAFGTTARKEEDRAEITSGLFAGKTDGNTLTIQFENNSICPSDYSSYTDVPRPGHADFVSRVKYGSPAPGGGKFSGRMTLPLVAAGVVAKKIIAPIRINATLLRSPDFEARLEVAVRDGDSIGGVVECVCTGVPVGLGEPFFDSMESVISHIVFSIPGVRGIEFGDGFAAADMRGSQHNDPIIDSKGATATNHCGGINGGISNGNPIIFRVAFKPTSSISKEQYTYNFATGRVEPFSVKGRHDSCFALRTPVVVESAVACVICGFML